MKTKSTLLIAFLLCGFLTGCGKSDKKIMGVSFQTMNNPFFVDLDQGLRSVIETKGYELVTMDAQWNSLKQKNDISDLILQGASAIFINPVNWEGIRGSLLEAKKKGIPCIIVDVPVKDKELALSTVASDNVEAGRLAGKALVAACSSAKIGILQMSVNKACIDRVAGFREIIEQYLTMEIVDVQEVKGNTESARPVMRDMIGRFPDINAVFPINDPSAFGVISALESAGKLDNVKIVSVDGSQEAIAAIQSGKLHSTSAQFPFEIGKIAAETIFNHFDGETVEPDIKVRVALITAENAAQFLKKE
ncbi:MAG: sugar ABC transporter substrate-binding protein [Candidatus Omnitrophota bacterium]|jgi:ribose transport system substrate-binding protein|nr:MAG: sugar ABC transporter substrate-binding protein [Candidatus Omnitrophota bacterium]